MAVTSNTLVCIREQSWPDGNSREPSFNTHDKRHLIEPCLREGLSDVLVSVLTGRLASRNARSRLDRFVALHDLLEQFIRKHAHDRHQTLNAPMPTRAHAPDFSTPK